MIRDDGAVNGYGGGLRVCSPTASGRSISRRVLVVASIFGPLSAKSFTGDLETGITALRNALAVCSKDQPRGSPHLQDSHARAGG